MSLFDQLIPPCQTTSTLGIDFSVKLDSFLSSIPSALPKSARDLFIMNLDSFLKNAKTAPKGSVAKPVTKSQSGSNLTITPAPVTKSQSGTNLNTIAPATAQVDTKKTTPSLSVFQGKKPSAVSTTSAASSTTAGVNIDINEFMAMDDIGRLLATENFIALDDSSTSLAKIISSCGITSPESSLILNKMTASIRGPSAQIREMGLTLLYAALLEVGRPMEPFTLPLMIDIVNLHGDRSTPIRDLAGNIAKRLSEIMSPHALRLVFPMFMSFLSNDDWRIRVGILNMIKYMAPRMPRQISLLLPELIPKATDCIYDAKKQVQYAAIEAMNEACSGITNDDIRPLVPQLISVIAHPEESIKTLDLLLETTFVANVDSPVLALIAPLLGKSLRGSQSSMMKRKASRVIDIMCRLVQDPRDVAPFMPLLLPALDKVIDEIADLEVCEVAKAARGILVDAFDGKVVHDGGSKPSILPTLDVTLVKEHLLSIVKQQAPVDAEASVVYVYIADLLSQLAAFGTVAHPIFTTATDDAPCPGPATSWKYAVAMTPRSEWRDCVVPYLSSVLKKKSSADSAQSSTDSIKDVTATAACVPESDQAALSPERLSWSIRLAALGDIPDNEMEANEDDANLCDIEFSLAFGGKILLHNTKLRLGKGRRYGVMGKNGAGKTTLLTNIGSGNIEGLPSHLKTVYVQHDDASDDFGVPLIEELISSKAMVEANVTKEEAAAALKKILFTDAMLEAPRSALSGGWKMKLLIIKAMLARADILLLDEPTNHLDVKSVEWLTNYINSQKEVTCLIVSHDTKFMDNVLTDVIHYESRKLVYYHGNLTHFVEIHPEAKYYYDLDTSDLSFKFPAPERLEGINSTTRAILKMDNCTYTYPGASKPTLVDCSVKVCLGSRIAVCGANGAGKSTLVKMLVQESEPDEGSGEVWKHINLRVAYVAQHSFHHVEQHLDSSPVDYMKWRFSGGVDKEEMTKPTKKLTEEEVEERKHGERKYGDVDLVVGRRKAGRSMEYECTWIGQVVSREPNKYILLEEMIAKGHAKLVQQCDAKVAAMAAGLDVRPLLTAEIQGHLNDFNLESEYGTFSTIRRLSGGQKVKLVLAAAMWNRPHVIILDEPTNYLDRQALGALTQAIKGFAGGVVIISHNSEFTDALCTEKWMVEGGQCFTHGGVEESALKTVSERAIKRSNSGQDLKEEKPVDEGAGNTNTAINGEVILNPRTLEGLTKKETRKLERCAAVAGMSLKDYVSKLTYKSPEWKWL